MLKMLLPNDIGVSLFFYLKRETLIMLSSVSKDYPTDTSAGACSLPCKMANADGLSNMHILSACVFSLYLHYFTTLSFFILKA